MRKNSRDLAVSSEEGLTKLRLRERALEGDALIVAASIVMISGKPLEERVQLRARISEALRKRDGVESSESWSKTRSEQSHCKVFKRLVRKYLELKLHCSSHSLVDSVVAEYLAY
jgi:hypothetical protein